MKFGAILEAEKYVPFSEGYVRYNELKASIASNEIGFGENLRAEVERVAAYGDKLKEEKLANLEALEKRWRTVLEWKRSDFPDVDKDVEKLFVEFNALAQEINRVLDFVTLNVTGIKKICKKHDRRTGEVSGPLLLSKLQRDAESAYLGRLSDPKLLEVLVTRCRDAMDAIREVRIKTGQDQYKRRELAPAGGPEYFSIPRSREISVNSSSQSSSFVVPSSPVQLDDFLPPSCVDTLAKPLLSSDHMVEKERPLTAFCGAFLAGVGFGGFWTICEVGLSPWAATMAVLVSSCGSITGTRPALSSMYYSVFAFAGAFSALLFASSSDERRHPLVNLLCAWLTGACVGAWTVQVPRQLVSTSSTSSRVRAAITFAPLFGSCLGALTLLVLQTSIAFFAQVYSLLWVCFFLYITVIAPLEELGGTASHPRANSSSEGGDRGDTSEEEEEEDVEAAHPDEWKKGASTTVVTLGALASLAIDRTVRTVVALEVVSFYPALWGEDFFLLSLGSILASFVGAIVPSWCCAMIGCVSIYMLNGPGFVAWMWVEASCRNDLANFSAESAPKADTILYVADFIACVVFALELSYLENPQDTPVGLTWASGFLLLASSVGRLISYRL